MKVSPELVGRVVTVQVARPLYVIDYAAHVKYLGKDEQLIGEPVMQGEKPLAMDVFLGVEVVSVTDDQIRVVMYTPGQHRSAITIPSGLILAITELTAFEPSDVPVVTTMKRQVAASKAPEPIIKL
jgi:hypothetical protein